MNFCKDCKHYNGNINEPWWIKFGQPVYNLCRHPRLLDPVTGGASDCELNRQFDFRCGPIGKKFEDK
jgi:hypothetical protein